VHNVDLEGDEEEDLFAMDEKGFEETDDNSEKIAYATKSRIHIQDGRFRSLDHDQGDRCNSPAGQWTQSAYRDTP